MECDRDSETGDNFLFVLDLKVTFQPHWQQYNRDWLGGRAFEIRIKMFHIDQAVSSQHYSGNLQELCTKGAAYDKRKTRLRIYEWGSNM